MYGDNVADDYGGVIDDSVVLVVMIVHLYTFIFIISPNNQPIELVSLSHMM